MVELEAPIMEIIMNAGQAKTHAYEALRKTNDGDYDGAAEELKKAEESINKAHHVQTSMLQKEAQGEKIDLSILFVHAQDHLMTAISEKSLIEQIIELRKVVNTLTK